MIFGLSHTVSAQAYSGGAGTSANPYIINNKTDLKYLSDHSTEWTKYFKQGANITFLDADYQSSGDFYYDGSGFLPIAFDNDNSGTPQFTGRYDGGGFTITNLYINRPNEANVGLFSHLGQGTVTNPAVIKNVNLVDVNVAGARGTGSLVGRVTGNIYTLIEDCSASGSAGNRSVTGDAATGGLVGSNNSYRETPGGTDNPIISKCWADIDVTYSGVNPGTTLLAEKFGGLSGCNQKGTILDSYALGSVTANKNSTWDVYNVGGLAGCISLPWTN